MSRFKLLSYPLCILMIFSPLFGFSGKLPSSNHAPINNVVQDQSSTADQDDNTSENADPTVRKLKSSGEDPKQEDTSHASNQTPSFVSIGVNPATLDLTANIALASFSLGSIEGFSLTLSYNQGQPSLYGSPKNWSYSIPYISNGVLSYNGAKFIIDRGWVSKDGHKSGLRYMNNSGVEFTNIGSQIDLPSYIPDPHQYQYKLVIKDGSVYYFDYKGKILAISDRYNNYILFKYDKQDSPESSRLISIEDSLGKKLEVTNRSSSIDYSIASSLGNITTKVEYGSESLRYTNPANELTTIRYRNNPYDSGSLISNVVEPNGLETDINYTGMPYKDETGKQHSLAVVQKIYTTDHITTKKSLVEYSFGQKTSGHNYTGYPNYSMIGDSSHKTLVESDNFDYRYDIQTITTDENTNVTKRATTYYNYLSLPVESVAYKDDGKTEKTREEIEYYIPIDRKAREGNFTLPVKKTSYVDNQATTKSEMTYDDKGNPLTVEVYDMTQNKPKGKLVSRLESTFDPKYSLSLTQLQTNGKITSEVVNTLSSDKKSIKSTRNYYQDIANKAVDYSYDSKGFVTNEKRYWITPSPQGGAQSTSVSHSYSFGGSTWTVTNIDADGNKTQSTFDLATSKLLSATAADGSISTNKYDLLGRLISHTSPSGLETSVTYNDSDNSSTIVTPTGSSKKQTDAKGNVIKTWASINPNSKGLVKTSDTEYDTFGNAIHSKDMLDNQTDTDYDNTGRPLKITDPLGNITEFNYDDTNRTVTVSVNGMDVKQSKSDVFGHVIEETNYPSSANSDYPVNYNIVHKYQRDDLGRVIKESVEAGGSLLYTLSQDYNGSGQVSKSTQNRGGTMVSIQNNYDLFGNVLNAIKIVKYKSGKSYTTNSDVKNYDQLGRVITSKTALGAVTQYSYDVKARTSTVKYPSGRTVTSILDNEGRPLQTIYKQANDSKTISYKYDQLGRVVSIGDGSSTQTTSYYGNSNYVKDFSYADKTSSSIVYDDYGRTKTYTGYSGDKESYTYDGYGRLSDKSNILGKFTYNYGNINGIEGVLTGYTSDGYTISSKVDALGRSVEAERRGKGNVLISKQVNTYDKYNNIVSTKLSSDLDTSSVSNYTTSYVYDDLNQLSQSIQRDSKGSVQSDYVYDGNGNLLGKVIDSYGDKRNYSYTYNKDDQLIEFNQNGYTYTPSYDVDGNMESDGTGNNYHFDETGMLSKANNVIYSYYADGLRKSRTGNTEDTFYYDGSGQVETIRSSGDEAAKNSKTVERGFVRDGSSVLASYTKGKFGGRSLDKYYFSNDNHGSVNLLASSDQVLEGKVKYSDYGNVQLDNNSKAKRQEKLLGTNSSDNFGYNGEYKDPETHLIYLKARDYDPSIERFISRDSYDVWNHYNFAGGNPIMYTDPSGHMAKWLGYALAGGMWLASAVATLATAGAAGESFGGAAAFTASVLGTASGMSQVGSLVAADTGHTKLASSLEITSIVTGAAALVAGGAAGIAKAAAAYGKAAYEGIAADALEGAGASSMSENAASEALTEASVEEARSYLSEDAVRIYEKHKGNTVITGVIDTTNGKTDLFPTHEEKYGYNFSKENGKVKLDVVDFDSKTPREDIAKRLSRKYRDGSIHETIEGRERAFLPRAAKYKGIMPLRAPHQIGTDSDVFSGHIILATRYLKYRLKDLGNLRGFTIMKDGSVNFTSRSLNPSLSMEAEYQDQLFNGALST